MSSDHIVGFILGVGAGVVLGAYLELKEEMTARAGKTAASDTTPKKPPEAAGPQRAMPAVA